MSVSKFFSSGPHWAASECIYISFASSILLAQYWRLAVRKEWLSLFLQHL